MPRIHADKRRSAFIRVNPRLTDSFRDAAARANQPPPVFLINPFRERGTLWPLGTVRVTVVFAFCGLRAAMFTEPAITQIEEVGRLVHRAESLHSISAAYQATPSNGPAPTSACRHARFEPEQFRQSDADRVCETDRLNLTPCRCRCQR